MRRSPLPPPERFTVADACRLAFGIVMIPLGIVILYRTLTLAVTAAGILVGLAFIGFGVHRLWLAWNRLHLLHRAKEKVQ